MKKILLSLAITISAIVAQAQTPIVVRHPRQRVVVLTRPAVARPVLVTRPLIVRPVRRRVVIVH
ncbi:hypothetical protein [Mucilaginibacter psychrotolerans]|uniref:Uncharacterized protein n=1 Tax=Mucilaginibacter psychrotolerans TaxID=1524096 RepID=A0A4Y8SMF0_9SPHI|nr:hypothetical protein [Mucilaginibacter psychrotolerans]TFF39634.1 hypothetical protein E2R66_04510 [Mucilaginibacter psychrotolerans]